jgi:hypothetical protein
MRGFSGSTFSEYRMEGETLYVLVFTEREDKPGDPIRSRKEP